MRPSQEQEERHHEAMRPSQEQEGRHHEAMMLSFSQTQERRLIASL